VRDLNRDNFGLLIAYLLPGFVVLLGLAEHVAAVHGWLGSTAAGPPTVGGFLYTTVGSTAAGMIVSAIRWLTLDHVFAWIGIRPPPWNAARFAAQVPAFEALVANHYRYYQHYSNMFIAIAFAAIAWLLAYPSWTVRDTGLILGIGLIEAILFLGSRDTLRKYHARTGALLREPESTDVGPVTR